jgi:hypothetical protein
MKGCLKWITLKMMDAFFNSKLCNYIFNFAERIVFIHAISFEILIFY